MQVRQIDPVDILSSQATEIRIEKIRHYSKKKNSFKKKRSYEFKKH